MHDREPCALLSTAGVSCLSCTEGHRAGLDSKPCCEPNLGHLWGVISKTHPEVVPQPQKCRWMCELVFCWFLSCPLEGNVIFLL